MQALWALDMDRCILEVENDCFHNLKPARSMDPLEHGSPTHLVDWDLISNRQPPPYGCFEKRGNLRSSQKNLSLKQRRNFDKNLLYVDKHVLSLECSAPL